MSARVHSESALRVSDCVTELLRKQPFFGSLVLRLPLRPDPSRETLATDGHEIRYSPRWVPFAGFAGSDSPNVDAAGLAVPTAGAALGFTPDASLMLALPWPPMPAIGGPSC